MSTAAPPLPLMPAPPAPTPPPPAAPGFRYYLAQSTFRKFTLDEYHRMIQTGVLTDGEPYELLEGNLVHKMARGTPHDTALDILAEALRSLLPAPWYPRAQMAMTLTNTGSEPEPDVAVVPGPRDRYRQAHPIPADVGLVVEVSDSSLAIDRHDKARIYAREGILVYWVVNIPEKQIEVYTEPGGTGDAAGYGRRDDYTVGTSVPVVVGGNVVGQVAVSEVVG